MLKHWWSVKVLIKRTRPLHISSMGSLPPQLIPSWFGPVISVRSPLQVHAIDVKSRASRCTVSRRRFWWPVQYQMHPALIWWAKTWVALASLLSVQFSEPRAYNEHCCNYNTMGAIVLKFPSWERSQKSADITTYTIFWKIYTGIHITELMRKSSEKSWLLKNTAERTLVLVLVKGLTSLGEFRGGLKPSKHWLQLHNWEH